MPSVKILKMELPYLEIMFFNLLPLPCDKLVINLLADTKSEKATLSKISELSAIEDCISVLPPLPFFVHSIVVTYKDFKNRPSVVFALHLVGDKDKNIIGYAIGAGRPGAI